MKINGIEISRALIIDEPWISKILSGDKRWEMRSSKTKIRGHIALIKKGSGTIVGTAFLSDVGGEFKSIDQLQKFIKFHHVDYVNNPELIKWNTPWVLTRVKKIDPIPYEHKRGAVIWVKI